MPRAAQEDLRRGIREVFQDFTVPLTEQQFAWNQHDRNLAPLQGVAHRAQCREGLAAARGMFEDAAAISLLPAFKRGTLVRAKRLYLAARGFLFRLETLRGLDFAANLVHQVRPVCRLRGA